MVSIEVVAIVRRSHLFEDVVGSETIGNREYQCVARALDGVGSANVPVVVVTL